MGSEVHSLASTCDLVHEGLAHVLTGAASEKHGSPYDHDGTLEKGICGQVAHCESTIEELGKIAERLWPRKKKFVDRTVRELRLQDAREQIDDLRARIRSHTDALHTVLLDLNIKVAHVSPSQALSQLPDDLGDLRESIRRIEAKLERPSAREVTADCNMPALVEYARGTLQSGITLFNESIAGSVVGVGSVIGGEQAAVTNKTVAEWVLSAEWTGNERHDVAPEHFADVNAHAPGHADCNSDDEQVEFAKTAFDAGLCAFYKEDWQSATEYFVVSKKTIIELPVNRRDLDTLLDLQQNIALRLYNLGFTDNAEQNLQEILQLEPVSDNQRILQCEANQLLARIYVWHNRLDAAKHICKRTSNARARLLGKHHGSRLRSIALLSRICKLLGDEVESKVYLSMIPEEHRERLTMAMSDVRPCNVDKPASSAVAVERQSVTTARATDSNRYSPRIAPTISTAGSKDRVSSAPIMQKPLPGPTTDPSRPVSTANVRPKGRDLQRDAAAQPEPLKQIPVLDATLPHRSTKVMRPSSGRTPDGVEEAKEAGVSPNANGKGYQGSMPRRTRKVTTSPRKLHATTASDSWRAIWKDFTPSGSAGDAD